tara:strand:+ start:1392 stop:1892 length:501 start_codon:yes stop_codon:yes gene_type:complete
MINNKVYLTAAERKVFLIDIGVWILILVKIYQIIKGVQMRIESINLPSIAIGFVVTVMAFWYQYDINAIQNMTVFQFLFNFGFIFVLGFSGAALIYAMESKKYCNNLTMKIKFYGFLTFIYAFISLCDTATADSYRIYGDIVILGIVFASLNILIGLFLLISDFEK